MKLISAFSLILPIFAEKELKKVEYSTPEVPAGAHLFESFDAGLPDSFIKTSGSKQDEDGEKYRKLQKQHRMFNFLSMLINFY